MKKYKASLPTKVNRPKDLDVKKFYEALDITVLGVDEDDDMFYDVEIPDDMEAESDGRYWYDFKDKYGNIHFQIFYKSAPYDKDAFINVLDETRERLKV